ncbi:hypothetical protein [Haloterrigena alkaliphila]|uniref:DUF5518 domain-containing protein n=1 Tax=Haloterrigena alkaliphila TaxID=2816475 RepID=A0A8A2VCW6_9EURY|nr:hypothetical protein [Haloterrigena alkaliphila]QSW99869.1 hypothetical protein J0X25_02585 [Haloterrigena alkaliphila]
MSEYESYEFDPEDVSFEWFHGWVVVGAVVVGALVNLTALMVPLLGQIGGGIVAGFLAAYAVGRFAMGLLHAAIASTLVGGVAGTVTALLGVTIGLFNEPPLLVLSGIGPVSPMLSGLGLPSALLIIAAFALLTVVDGLVGGLLGAGVRALLPW